MKAKQRERALVEKEQTINIQYGNKIERNDFWGIKRISIIFQLKLCSLVSREETETRFDRKGAIFSFVAQLQLFLS